MCRTRLPSRTPQYWSSSRPPPAICSPRRRRQASATTSRCQWWGQSGYFRAKSAQEKLIENSAIPYSIVHATQFFEFVRSMADAAADGGTVRFAPVLFQPIAGDDVAQAVARISVNSPLNGIVEVAGPQQFRMDEFFRDVLAARGDPRAVVTDPSARYFGT